MKVGIVTFFGQINYGQNLQLWALCRFLKKSGHDPFLIRYYPVDFAFNPSPPLHGKDDDKINVTVATAAAYVVHAQNDLYARRIHDFIDRNIAVSPLVYGWAQELKKNPPEADIYITGSDQIWNFWGRPYDAVKDNEVPAFFLDFGRQDVKRLAFAASFGSQTLDAAYKGAFTGLLSHFDYVSVREKSGIELCAQCGVQADWVPDPTMLIGPQDYISTLCNDEESVKYTPDKPYILAYMVNPNPAAVEKICNIAARRNLGVKIVGGNLGYILAYPGITVSATIGQFLHLFANADYVFTDSFHGTSFSLIFNKQFANLPSPVFGKDEARFVSIFERFGLRSQTADRDFNLPQPVDYASVNKIFTDIMLQYNGSWLDSVIRKKHEK